MDNQPSNGSSYDEIAKLLGLRSQDGPRGESAANGGGFESTEEHEYAWGSIPGTEGKCMAISIAGEL